MYREGLGRDVLTGGTYALRHVLVALGQNPSTRSVPCFVPFRALS